MKKLVLLLAAAIMASAANAELIVKIEDLTNGSTAVFSNNSTDNALRNIDTTFTNSDFSIYFTAKSYNPFGRISTDISQSQLNYYPWLGFNFAIGPVVNALDLMISVTDTDFVYPLRISHGQNLTANYAGMVPASPGNISVDYFYNLSNVAFDANGAQSISYDTSSGQPTGGILTNVDVLVLSPDTVNPFSLTQVMKFHMDAGSNVYAGATSAVVPEPGMLLLLTIGAAGLILGRRRG